MNILDFPISFRYRINYLYRFWHEKGFRATYNFFIARLYWATGFFQTLLLKRFGSLLNPYPCLIEIEPTTYCNLKCKMCEHTYWHEKPRHMTFEQFKSIIDQFPRLRWIGLTGIGGSFVNPDFMKMLRYVKSKKIYVELYDTFFLVDKEIARELVDIGVDRILPSIDAATKKTYEKIRVGSDFNRVIKNVKNLIKIKKERGLNFPEIDFHYIVSNLNIHEMVEYIDFVHSIDKDVKKITFTNLLHPFKEINRFYIPSVPDELIKRAQEKGKELGIRVEYNLNVDEKKPPIEDCTYWIIPFIFATGHVIICCAGNEANQREFQKRFSFGNVFEKPFKEIWKSKEYREARKMIREGKAPIQCKSCPSFTIHKKQRI